MHAPKSRMPSRRARSRNAAVVDSSANTMSWKPAIRLGQRRKLAARRRRPSQSKRARIDEHAADHDAVAGQELGRRVEDEVGAVVERPHQVGRRERRVDEQRQPVLVRERRDARDVEHVEPGIAERLAEQQPRLRPDRRAPGVEVARIDERRLDAEARQRVVEQVVRAAVQRARRDDVRARAHAASRSRGAAPPVRSRSRSRRRRLRARRCAPRAPRRRVGDARIDVARALHVEQRRRVVAVRKHERRGLVDRRRARAGRRIGPRARRAATACRSGASSAWSSAVLGGRRMHGSAASPARAVTTCDADAATSAVP